MSSHVGLARSRRSSSASTASRMNCARRPGPHSRSTRAITASESRTCVALMPSAGLPMRDGVSDTATSDKPIPPIDSVSDTGFIVGIAYGDKSVTITDRDLYELGMNTDMIAGYRAQMSERRKNMPVLWPEHFTGRRWEDWKRGTEFASRYKHLQQHIGCRVRSARNKDFAGEEGATSTFVARGAARKAQQLESLRIVTAGLRIDQ